MHHHPLDESARRGAGAKFRALPRAEPNLIPAGAMQDAAGLQPAALAWARSPASLAAGMPVPASGECSDWAGRRTQQTEAIRLFAGDDLCTTLAAEVPARAPPPGAGPVLGAAGEGLSHRACRTVQLALILPCLPPTSRHGDPVSLLLLSTYRHQLQACHCSWLPWDPRQRSAG